MRTRYQICLLLLAFLCLARSSASLAYGPAKKVASESEIVYQVTFSPNGKLLAAAGRDGTLTLWDATTWRKTVSLECFPGWVLTAVFSLDGQLVYAGGSNKQIKNWLITGKLMAAWENQQQGTTGLAITRQGKRLASAGGDGTIKLWDAGTLKLERTLAGHAGSAFSVSFSADGKLLASAGRDGTVRVWDVGQGRSRHTLKAHAKGAFIVAFSPDGKVLASGGADNAVRLWDPATGKLLKALSGHKDMVTALTFFPRGGSWPREVGTGLSDFGMLRRENSQRA